LSQRVLDILKAKFGPSETLISTDSVVGDEIAEIKPEAVLEVVRFLRDDSELKFNLLADLTVVDWPREEPRFEVVYHFYSIEKKHRLRLKARVGGFDEEPEIDSVTSLYSGANWLEREAFDLYGVRFRGHPDLKRILMYEGFEGHPLRKDYPINKRQPIIGPKQ
jgi:NADH-quinone oxidoreductase subunit C